MNEIIRKIYTDILNKMRYNDFRVDDLLPMKWICLTYRFQLNPEEQRYLGEAIEYLISNGYVTLEGTNEGRIIDGLVLTQAGYDFIYGN
ncbi:hypothetical protein [Brachyspira aalborgi]|uniref:Uncharacterized protein n=1 Tax=Brachyspira aalborgi TaxID=29522 RepID=A0A5C8CJ80_9SPIR|nr:hypothetical protein [Brachyspira aalborgi]TXJ12401.1 hypothetical protein EPJ80_06350 [Brachyspira aalborgi]